MNLPSESELIKELCERSFKHYVRYSWNVLEPMTEFKDNWHIDAICEYLQALHDGEIKRLLVNIPPRMLKSIIFTIMYPTWDWIKYPHHKFIGLSYSDTLSKGHNIKKRDIVASHWYQKNWGDKIRLKDDMNTQKKFENTRGGVMYSSSVGGTVTGEGADTIMFDDPHNPKQAESDIQRSDAIEFFKGTVQSRLNDHKTGKIAVIMQRLHDQDISGYILSNELGYEHLCLPMEFEQKTMIWLPKSKIELIKEAGELLQPDRFGKEEIENLKKTMGSYSYSGQYQQSPTPKTGGMFKKYWWNYWIPKGMLDKFPPVAVKNEKGEVIYKTPVELPELTEQAQSWDAAFKGNDDNDKVACGVWGKANADKFLLHLINENMTFTQTVAAIKNTSEAYPVTQRKLIEEKANGAAIIDTLKSKVTGIIPINPGNDSKEARAESITPQIEAGNVYIPHPMLYSWVDEFIETCAKFPKVPHDDVVDQMSQMLIYWNNKKEIRVTRI